MPTCSTAHFAREGGDQLIGNARQGVVVQHLLPNLSIEIDPIEENGSKPALAKCWRLNLRLNTPGGAIPSPPAFRKLLAPSGIKLCTGPEQRKSMKYCDICNVKEFRVQDLANDL